MILDAQKDNAVTGLTGKKKSPFHAANHSHLESEINHQINPMTPKGPTTLLHHEATASLKSCLIIELNKSTSLQLCHGRGLAASKPPQVNKCH